MNWWTRKKKNLGSSLVLPETKSKIGRICPKRKLHRIPSRHYIQPSIFRGKHPHSKFHQLHPFSRAILAVSCSGSRVTIRRIPGRPDIYVEGLDRNRDGIPDILQQASDRVIGSKHRNISAGLLRRQMKIETKSWTKNETWWKLWWIHSEFYFL